METALFNDITVLELAQGVSGPYAAMQLGDFGARVIKIEPPPGDWSRAMGPPFVDGESTLFLSLNRNKRSLVLDYTTYEGLKVLQQLIPKADVLILDMLPAERDAHQLSYSKLVEFNPQLIYCAISPFGEQGPMANQPGSELGLQAVSGYSRYVGEPDGEPVRLGADIAGVNTGIVVYQAVVAALVARQQSGAGQDVYVSQLGSLLTTKTIILGAQYNPDDWDGFHLQSTTQGPEYGWQTQDQPITFDFSPSPEGWQEFCRRLGLTHLIDDPRFAAWYRTMCLGAESQSLRQEYERGFADKSSDELVEMIRNLGGNAFPYLDYEALLDSEQVESLNILEDVPQPNGNTLRMIGFPWQFSGETQPQVRSAPPRLGADTDVILQEFELNNIDKYLY